jgi:hypothetical protein
MNALSPDYNTFGKNFPDAELLTIFVKGLIWLFRLYVAALTGVTSEQTSPAATTTTSSPTVEEESGSRDLVGPVVGAVVGVGVLLAVIVLILGFW